MAEPFATAPATYGSIGNATAGYYARKLLSHALPVIILDRWGMSKELPRNMTKVMQWRRSLPIPPALTPLVEGTTPTGGNFGYTTVSLQIQQYGDYQTITDVVQDTSKDQVLSDMAQRQGEAIGTTMERLTWDVVRAGTSVTYSGGATARTGLTNTHTIKVATLRTVNTELSRNKAAKHNSMISGSASYATFAIEPTWVAVGHTDLKPDLRDLKSSNNSYVFFTTPERYGKRMVTSPHEAGSFEDFRFILSPDLPERVGAGTTMNAAVRNNGSNNNVYEILCIGRESYGCIALRGRNSVKPMVLNAGVPRGGDPLGQRGTIGWKTYFACKRFNESWQHRIECTASV